MIPRKKQYYFLSALGTLLIIATFLEEHLYNRIFWLSFIIIGGLFLGLFAFLILFALKADIIGLLLCLTLLFISGGLQFIDKEYFKSSKVLEAELISDLDIIKLTLRANNRFEIETIGLFGFTEKITGKYKIKNDKIYFLSKKHYNELIPDTVTIIHDKIILKYNQDGQPCTDYASFFQLKKINNRH